MSEWIYTTHVSTSNRKLRLLNKIRDGFDNVIT